jgi:hypothetical protein
MWKVIVDSGETKIGPSWSWLDFESKHTLDKLASVGTHVPPSLVHKIEELKGTLPHNKVAFYNRALGAFESFGLNRNGDGFEKRWLQRNHDTFVKNAHYFKHHVNKDTALSRGRPVASAFNEETDMVDLIIMADRDKCEEQIQALESGNRVPTSMGAKVAHDVCTICENKAKTRAEYCEHVKQAAMEPYGMGKVIADGRICGVMNPDPKFFDISDVIIGAAPESETLMKVASSGLIIPSAELADLLGISKWAEDKESAHIKEIPGDIDGYAVRDRSLVRGLENLSKKEDSIPDELIDRSVEKGGIDGLIRASSAMGIVLKPREFSRAAKLGSFKAPTWKEVLASDLLPAKIMRGGIEPGIAHDLMDYYQERSAQQPALLNRVQSLAEKRASREPVFGEDDNAKKMYTAYRASMVKEMSDAGGKDGEYWSIKCAGTSSRNFSRVSQAYACSAFLSPDVADVKEKVLDHVEKFANHHRSAVSNFGEVSGSMADEIGTVTLDLVTVNSLSIKAR